MKEKPSASEVQKRSDLIPMLSQRHHDQIGKMVKIDRPKNLNPDFKSSFSERDRKQMNKNTFIQKIVQTTKKNPIVLDKFLNFNALNKALCAGSPSIFLVESTADDIKMVPITKEDEFRDFPDKYGNPPKPQEK
jgi:hypothetical protein